MATTFERFKRDASNFFILNFPDKVGKPKKSVGIDVSSVIGSQYHFSIYDLLRVINYKRYSTDEIVSRARSKIGENHYSLITNNCEHFAIWCATNVHESHQVQKILGASGRDTY